MTLDAKITLQVAARLAAAGDLSSGVDDLRYKKDIWLLTGAGANQADQTWHDQRTIAASANEDLDLAGALVNRLGQTVAFARVKAIAVVAAAGNSNNVVVGAAASNAFVGPFGAAAHTVAVKPGGALLLVAPDAAGWAVTAGTGDLLRIANGGAGSSVTYDIILIGATS